MNNESEPHADLTLIGLLRVVNSCFVVVWFCFVLFCSCLGCLFKNSDTFGTSGTASTPCRCRWTAAEDFRWRCVLLAECHGVGRNNPHDMSEPRFWFCYSQSVTQRDVSWCDSLNSSMGQFSVSKQSFFCALQVALLASFMMPWTLWSSAWNIWNFLWYGHFWSVIMVFK